MFQSPAYLVVFLWGDMNHILEQLPPHSKHVQTATLNLEEGPPSGEHLSGNMVPFDTLTLFEKDPPVGSRSIQKLEVLKGIGDA